MRAVLTGGGTGGHIYPALSVGQALREAEPTIELLFVGSSHGPEGCIAREAGLEFQAVPSSPLTKSVSLQNVRSLARLVGGYYRARRILKGFGPDVVVGTGGYTTAAILLAASRLGYPTVIHEQNAVAGRTNLWLSRFVDRVCVTLDSTVSEFPAGKVALTGMPVRREFAALPGKAEARAEFGLVADAFTILVVGGSQGARRINELMLDAWPLISEERAQVLHQAGAKNVDAVRAQLVSGTSSRNTEGYVVEPYVDMPAALAAADLVIGRSGASTLAEITAAGLPCILIPYPYAYADHQRLNAEYVARQGAAIVCDESEATADGLASLIRDLKSNQDKLARMAAASKALGKPDAARAVAEVAISLVNS